MRLSTDRLRSGDHCIRGTADRIWELTGSGLQGDNGWFKANLVYFDCLSTPINQVSQKMGLSTLFAVCSSISLSISLMQLVSYVSGGRGSLTLSLHSSPLAPPSFFRLSGNSSFAADYSEPTKQRRSPSARFVVQFCHIPPILLSWKQWLPFGWTTTAQPDQGNSAVDAETTARRRPDGPN